MNLALSFVIFLLLGGFEVELKIKSIKKIENASKKYDLTTGNHNYYANDILVHNCGIYSHYENGEFKYARSRGNGEIGEDTTVIFTKVNIPKKIDNFTGNIRGELLLKRSVWQKHFPGTKNPRNTAAGLVQRLDSEDSKYLTFAAYDVFDNNNIADKTETSKLEFLKNAGFEIPEYKVNPTFEEIKSWKDSIDTEKAEIPCDGIVIKQNKVDKNDLMRHTPLNNVAYKPNLQIAITKVIDIEWSMKGRYLAPVAIVEPVELCGTTVKRASLANINIMKELGVEIGSTVEITKSGEIIPKILKVVA